MRKRPIIINARNNNVVLEGCDETDGGRIVWGDEIYSGFTTEWTITDNTLSGRTITIPLPISGLTVNDIPFPSEPYDCVIHWGDGYSSVFTNDNQNNTHTYATTGVYYVNITGKCPAISFTTYDLVYEDGFPIFKQTVSPDINKITDIIYWGEEEAFDGFYCLDGAFEDCINIKSTGSGKIIGENLTTLTNTFRNCSSISGITSNIFDNLINLESCEHTFRKCNNLTSLPQELFRYNTGITSFAGTFLVSGLVEIPQDFFKYNINVKYFGKLLAGCFSLTKITTIPEDLFRYNTEAESFDFCFTSCELLETVPDHLFRYNRKAYDFSDTFYDCKKLRLNPWMFYADGEQSTRFIDAPAMMRWGPLFGRFEYTNDLPGTAPDLWNCTWSIYSTDYTSYVFSYPGNSTISLTNYNDIPSGWK